jgi:hypothetical protein
VSFEHVRYTCFFCNMDKVEINNIKNSCASHMLLKKWAHVTFTYYIERDSFNPVWRKTLSLCEWVDVTTQKSYIPYYYKVFPYNRSVNQVRFFAKIGTGTGVPQFLVLKNWNGESGPGYWPVPVCTRSGNRFFFF